MLLVKWTLMGLLLLPAAETVVFILVVVLFGWIWAILLFMGTTFAGLNVLWRTGRGDLNRFVVSVKNDGVRAIHLNSPGLGPMLGGFLLVVPGFITDFIGILLFIPQFRRWTAAAIGRKLKQRQGRRHPFEIDLEPRHWRQVTDATLKNQRR
jgi:UPF0716 protein FxsA